MRGCFGLVILRGGKKGRFFEGLELMLLGLDCAFNEGK